MRRTSQFRYRGMAKIVRATEFAKERSDSRGVFLPASFFSSARSRFADKKRGNSFFWRWIALEKCPNRPRSSLYSSYSACKNCRLKSQTVGEKLKLGSFQCFLVLRAAPLKSPRIGLPEPAPASAPASAPESAPARPEKKFMRSAWVEKLLKLPNAIILEDYPIFLRINFRN